MWQMNTYTWIEVFTCLTFPLYVLSISNNLTHTDPTKWLIYKLAHVKVIYTCTWNSTVPIEYT